jgi:hypothetical protein
MAPILNHRVYIELAEQGSFQMQGSEPCRFLKSGFLYIGATSASDRWCFAEYCPNGSVENKLFKRLVMVFHLAVEQIIAAVSS